MTRTKLRQNLRILNNEQAAVLVYNNLVVSAILDGGFYGNI